MMRAKRGPVGKARYAAIVLTTNLMLLLTGVGGSFDSGIPVLIPAVMAGPDLGILGRQAPELNLTDWIDNDGKRMDPIRLTDYRGKVVYLYFFQDW